jgi:chromate transporter
MPNTELIISFLKIGAFSFGGGYTMIPFIQKEIIYRHQWIPLNDFIDIVGIAEITPGPIAINSSTFVGYRIGGVIGSLLSTVSVVLVPFLLVMMLAPFFLKIKDSPAVRRAFKGIRPAIIGLIASAAITLGKAAMIDIKSMIICIVVFVVVYRVKFHPVFGIIAAGMLGVILY